MQVAEAEVLASALLNPPPPPDPFLLLRRQEIRRLYRLQAENLGGRPRRCVSSNFRLFDEGYVALGDSDPVAHFLLAQARMTFRTTKTTLKWVDRRRHTSVRLRCSTMSMQPQGEALAKDRQSMAESQARPCQHQMHAHIQWRRHSRPHPSLCRPEPRGQMPRRRMSRQVASDGSAGELRRQKLLPVQVLTPIARSWQPDPDMQRRADKAARRFEVRSQMQPDVDAELVE